MTLRSKGRLISLALCFLALSPPVFSSHSSMKKVGAIEPRGKDANEGNVDEIEVKWDEPTRADQHSRHR